MKKIIYKIGFITFILAIFLGFNAPFLFSQGNLFEPLQDIEKKVEEPQTRPGESQPVKVEIIEFSKERPWGNLQTELVSMLERADFTDLNDLASKAEYKQATGNVQDLINYLQGLTLTDSKGNDVTLSQDDVNLILNEIRFKGESQLQSVILSLAKVMRNLIGGIAIFMIVYSGIQMIFVQGDEAKVTEQKNSITYAIIGLITVLLLERGIYLLYGVPGVERGVTTTGPGISSEVLGLVSFIRAIIGAAAMLMIIISGYKIISAEGAEDKITKEKKGVMWIIIGIVVILINQFIVENLYIQPVLKQITGQGQVITQTNITNIINTLGNIIKFLLGFVGIVAFAALIYGAGSLIASYTNEEMAGRAKKIIVNALVGIIVILSAYAIVSTLIKFG